MSKKLVQAVTDILFQTDPAGCASPKKDEYASEAKMIVDIIKEDGDIPLKKMEDIFDQRFSGYYDVSLLEEAHTDIEDAIQWD